MNKFHWFRRLISFTYFPIAFLIVVNIAIGAFVVGSYGESWDERTEYVYARNSLRVYFHNAEDKTKNEGGPLYSAGPFYVMVARLTSEGLKALDTNRPPKNKWHFVHFLSFQMGLFFFYFLCLRLMSKWAAIGATLMFATQPLLWGHAFINPKDIPFMSFFLGTIAMGIRMAENNKPTPPDKDIPEIKHKVALGFSDVLGNEWKFMNIHKRRKLIVSFILFFGFTLILLLILAFLGELITFLLNYATAVGSNNLVGKYILLLANNIQSVPIEDYILKGRILYSRIILSYGIILIIISLITIRLDFPRTIDWILNKQVVQTVIRIRKTHIANRFHYLLKILLAGLFLGFCSNIRILGPMAGFLVSIYLFKRSGFKALPILILLGVTHFTRE